MNGTVSNQSHWKRILRQQQLANAEHWLAQLSESDEPASLVLANYDNLLRALEFTLRDPQTFKIAFLLIQDLHTIIVGYADWDRWLSYLKKALELSKKQQDSMAQARLLEQIADIMFHTGKLQHAESHYQESATVYFQLEELPKYATVLVKLAPIYAREGQPEKGIQLCHKALSIAEELKASLLTANIHLNLSHIQYHARNWQSSLDSAQTAYKHYRELNKKEFTAKALSNIIACWAQLGKWKQANDTSEELIEILELLGDIQTLAAVKNNLGIIAFNQANYETAESAWQEALRLHSQMQEPAELAGIYNNLGMVYIKIEEWDEAYAMLDKAISIYHEIGDLYNWANSMDNLADLHAAQGKTADFRTTLQTAIASLETVEQTPHIKKLLHEMRQRLA